jgi:hypothetical protein
LEQLSPKSEYPCSKSVEIDSEGSGCEAVAAAAAAEVEPGIEVDMLVLVLGPVADVEGNRPAGDPSQRAQNWILARFAAEADAEGSLISGVV